MVENKVTVGVWVYGMLPIAFSQFLDSTHFWSAQSANVPLFGSVNIITIIEPPKFETTNSSTYPLPANFETATPVHPRTHLVLLCFITVGYFCEKKASPR